MSKPFLLAQAAGPLFFDAKMASRHGLIAGATGTGKTATLRVLAEGFSTMGVPVFMADVKADLAGLAQPGMPDPKIDARLKQIGLVDFSFAGFPVAFWDLFGATGHPLRTTISEMGPLLLARVLNLNETQEGVLNLVFRIADENGLLLLDLDDLRSMCRFVGENAAEFKTKYGNVSTASIGAIQRNLLTLEDQGAGKFFGEPALNLDDLIQTAPDGRGVINILAAETLMQNPRTYATALLWLLAELYEQLPEVGDLDKPKLVFFFDEAHLLFEDIPKVLEDKIEQVVRLIRSKGVGVFFITQNPLDIPEDVIGQLGNRVQHALRAFTARDQKAVRAAAETFRTNPKLDIASAITELGVGEALVSLLDEHGTPGIVERALIAPPHSRLGPLSPAERAEIVRSSTLYGTYEKAVDRKSAEEMLAARAEEKAAQQAAPEKTRTTGGGLSSVLFGSTGPRGGRREGMVETMAKSAVRTVGSSLGREIMRGVLGSLFGGGRRR